MQIALFRTFLAVHRAGSFTKAAQLLGVSQSSVTGQIRALEKDFGRSLFERTPAGAVPTELARELARDIAEHLDALEAVGLRNSTPDPTQGPIVRIGGPVELTTTRLLPALTGIVSGGLRLRVTFGGPDDLLPALAAGDLDLVVSTVRPRTRGISAAPLLDEEFILVAAAESAARIDRKRLRTRGVEELSGVPWIAYAEHLPLLRHYFAAVFDSQPTMSADVVLPDLRGVLAMVVAGAGISVLPRHLCRAELDKGGIVQLLTPKAPPVNTIYLATRSGALAAPHLADLHARILVEAQEWN